MLRHKGIDATEQLATSDNAKVVIVGGGKDGLPLILNTGQTMPIPEKPKQKISGQSTPNTPDDIQATSKP